MLNKDEIIEDIKDASRETIFKVVGILVELCNLRDEVNEDQKSIISNLETQNCLLKEMVKNLEKKEEEEK